MTQINRLPALPSLPRIRPQFACACGCGRLTARTFAPGHDAKLKGGCVRVARGLLSLEQVAEYMGQPFADAVKKALGNRELMTRWQVEIPAAVDEKVG